MKFHLAVHCTEIMIVYIKVLERGKTRNVNVNARE